jgi:hypothetical protein
MLMSGNPAVQSTSSRSAATDFTAIHPLDCTSNQTGTLMAYHFVRTVALLALAACVAKPGDASTELLAKWNASHRAIVLVLNPASCALSQDAAELLNSLQAQHGTDGHLLAFGISNQAEAARATTDIGLRYSVHYISDQEVARLGGIGSTPLLAIVDRGQVAFLYRGVDFDRLSSWLPAVMRSLRSSLYTRIQ